MGDVTGEMPTATPGRPQGLVIAIDGPSGSGKSTVARKVAGLLGLAYLDTGAMYRAATWWCLRQGVALVDVAAAAAETRALGLEMGVDPREPYVRVAGEDVSADIRRTAISAAVSAIATNLEVRAEMHVRQRAIIAAERAPGSFSEGRGVVVEGRDITTVVAPDAAVRLLLTASEESRLARRARDVHGVVDAASLQATRDQVLRRDADDSAVAEFQVAADGVVTIDSSHLSVDRTVEAVLKVVRKLTGVVP